MAAVFSGNGLGLFDSSWGRWGIGAGGTAGLGQGGDSQYVNVATGGLLLQGQDEQLVFRGVSVAQLRTYNSQGTVAQAGADGWVTGFERRVTLLSGTFDTAGSVMRVDTGDGGTQDFTWAGPGRYVSSQGAGADDTLAFTAASATWALTEGSTQRQWLFADHADPVRQGRLLQIRDLRSDDTTPAAWDVLYDASNRVCEVREADGTTTGDALVFGYDGNGRLALLSTRENGVIRGQVSYGYDAYGRLSEVLVDLTPEINTDPQTDDTWNTNSAAANDGHLFRTVYAYDGTSLRIASVTHSDGTVVSYTYDASCRVRTVTRGDTNTNDADGAGQTVTYAYDDASGTTDVTDAAGRTWSYVHDAQGRLTQVLAPAISGLRDVTAYTYDIANRLVQVKSTRGAQVLAQTDYAYDTSGNRTWEWTLVDPAQGASAIQRTYDAANQLLTETHYTGLDADGAGSAQAPTGGLTTHFVYDAQSRVRFVIDAAGRVTEYQYATSGNAIGQQVSARRYLGAAYTGATYTLADLAAWAPAQQANSALTETTYDAGGRVLQVTQYASVASDGSGVMDDTAQIVIYNYDPHGLLSSTVTKRSSTATANDGRDIGDVTTYTYDGMGRLVAETDAASVVTTWVYLDSAGTLRTTLATGLQRTQVRDAAGQLVSVTESAVADPTNTRTTRNYYDANGQLRASEDAAGGRTYYFYDAKGALVGRVDETGALIETLYDGVGRATATKAYSVRLDTSSWLVNGVVVPTTYTAPTDLAVRTTAYTYDDAGRLLTQTDAAGTVTAYTYDGDGRLVQTAVTDPADPTHPRVTRQLYDSAERLVGTLDAEGYLTEFQYDVASRLVATIRYATATPTAQRASGTLAQLRPATDALHDQVTRHFYDGRDQLVGELDAESYLTEYVYDEAQHQRAERRYAKQLTGLTGSESFGTLRTAATGGVHETRRTFNALGQVITELNFEGTVTRYTYDAAGRLTGTVMADATSDMREGHRRYDVFGNLIGELGGEGSTHLVANMTEPQLDALYAQYGTRHSYDALGRRIESIDAQGNKTWYFYDAASRPTFVVCGVAENNAGATGALNSYAEVTETRYDTFGEVLDTTAYTGRIALATPGDRASVASALTTLAYISAVDSRRSQTWTARGQLASVTDAEGTLTQYAYDAFGELTRTDRGVGTTAAATNTYTYDRRGLQTGSTEALGATEQRSTSQVYDAFGRVLTATDARASVTSFGYDRLGRLLTRSQTVQGRTETTTTAYDAYSRITSVIDAEGATTSYFYNDAARSLTVTTPENIVVTTVHTRNGQTWTVTDGAGHTTTYNYDDDGHLKTTQDALGNVATNSYDTRGLLVRTTDASLRAIKIDYDAVGRVLQRTVDPDGTPLTTRYQYDGQGRQLQVTDPSGHVTQYGYDREGRLTLEVRDPNGLALRTRYTYDALGRQVTVVQGDGTAAARTVQYTYDVLGRRTSEIVDPGTGHLNLTTTYVYDGNDNVIRRTDANGAVTRFYYDEADRLTCSVDPLGGVTRNWYDADGRLVATRSYAQASELALADTTALSAIDASLVARPEEQGNYRVYDRDGRLRFTIDLAGTVVETAYGADNRVVATRQCATTFTPDATLQTKLLAGTALPGDIVVTHNDALDLQSYAVYDAAGRQRYAIDALGNVEERYYDAAGRQVGTRRYATVLTAANLAALKPALQAGTAALTDVASRLVVDDTHDLRSYVVFDAAGRATYAIDALGAVQQTFYDAAGHQVGQVAYATAITVDAALLGKLKAGASVADITAKLTTAILNDVRNTEHYQVFDAAGRLIDAIEIVRDAAGNATGLVQQTTWDTADGVTVQASLQTSLTDANVDTHTAELRAGTATPAAVMTWLGTTGGTRYMRSLLDAAGRVHYQLARNGASTLQVTERTYDAMGRLVQETVYANTIPDTAITDAAVQSALTGSASRITRYAYDAAGHLRFQVDDMGGVSERLYDALGRMVEERSYDTRINVAGTLTESAVLAALDAARQTLWSTDLASLPVTGLNTANVGAYGSSLVYANGQLVFTPADPDSNVVNTTAYPTVYRTQSNATSGNVVFRAEMTTSSPVTSYFVYGVENLLSGANYRRAALYVNNGVLYSHSMVGSTNINRAVGTLSPNQTYVIEAQSRAGGVDYFVYVKGTDKANGFRYTITEPDQWDAIRLRMWSIARDGAPSTPTYLDNLSESIAPSRHTSYRYDAAGRLVETTDALGNRESYGYDARGLMTTRTDKLGNVWTYAYDAAGRKTTETSPAVSVASTSFSAGTWQTTSATRAVVTFYTYDALGNVLTKTEDYGQSTARTTTYQYDNAGHQIRTVFPRAWQIDTTTGQLTDSLVASEINVTYDALGRAVVEKDVRGNTSYKVYDTEGRVAYDIDQEGYVTGYTYNAFGEQATLTRYANRFDFTKLTGWTTGSAVSLAQMATAGALVSDAANDRALTTAYDLLGRKTSVTQSAITYRKNDGTSATGSPTTTFAYNSYGELVQQSVLVEGSTWAVTTHYYDDLGREILTVDPQGYVTRTAYDAEGDVTEVTEFARAIDTSTLSPSVMPALPAAGDAQVGYDRVTRYTYDALGRKASQVVLRHYERSDGSSGLRNVESDFVYDALDHLTTTTADGVMVLQTSYDALGRATSTQEAARDVLRSDADSQLLAHTTNDLGTASLYEQASPYTTVAYDAFGNAVKTVRYANGMRNGTATADASRDQVSTAVYDHQGRAVVAQDVYGNTICSQYDAADHVTKSWYTLSGSATSRDANITAVYQYDKVGRQTTTTVTRQLTSGGTVYTERADVVGYNAFGDIITKTASGPSAPPGTLTYIYDKAGNLTSSNETGAARSFGYNLAGARTWEQRTVSELNSSNVATNYTEVWRQVVDLLGRTTESILPSHTSDRTIVNTVVNTVDRWGNVLQQVDPRGFITRFEYDEQNNKTRQVAPLVEVVGTDGLVRWQAPETHWMYDALGRLVATRDANGNVSQTVYNAAGQAIRTVDGTGAVSVTGIDALGNERLSQNAIGYITWQTFDRLGRVTAQGDYLPDANNVARVSTTLQSYVLNETGQRTKVTDALGSATLYDYDSGNNLLRSQTAMGVVKTDTYDVLGNKTSENDGIATQAWQYDIFGHVLDHDDLSAKDYNYTYDSASGQLTAQTSGWGASSTTSYYANGQVRHITEGASVWYDYQYDANGNRTVEETSTVDGGGLVIRQRTTNTYDSNNRLTRVVSNELDSAGTFVKVLLDVRYGYDAAGNRRVVVADSGTGTGVTQPNVSNKLPVVIGTPENRSVKLGTTTVLGLQPGLIFRDPDGAPLTYSATLSNGTALPSWLTLDTSRLGDTGHLYFTVASNAPAGSVAVRLKATDAAGGAVTVDFTISTTTNTTPVSTGGATPVFKSVVGQPIAFELGAADLFKDSDAGDALTLTLSTVSPAATWLTADGSTAGALRLGGTPTAAGTYTLTIVATDGSGATVSRTVQLSIAANAAPVAVTVATQNVVIGSQFRIERTLNQLFTDANNDDLTLSATLAGGAPLPSWMSLQVLGDTQPPTVRIVGCAPDMAPGTSYSVVLTAKDPSGATATNTVTISVWKDPGEFIVFNPIQDVTIQPGAWTYQIPSNTFWNRNSLPMTLSASGMPAGVTFNATTGLFSGTASTAGTWTVTVKATISTAQTLTDTFVITVPNYAPTIYTTGIPDQWTHTSKPYSYTIPSGMFRDQNSDALSYSATGLPSGVTLSTAGVFSGTPTVAGTYNITVTVNDNHGGTVTDVFVLHVGNRVPRLVSGIPDQARTGGTAINYSLPAGTFVDDDGDAMTYTATGLPTGVTMSTAGVFSGNVPASGGPYNVTVTANDGYGGTVTDTFVLTITPANLAPIFDKSKLPDVYVPYGSSLSVGAAPAFSDPNGDHLTFSLVNTTLPAWLTWNATTATFTGTNSTTADGTFTRVITVQASDGKGGTVSGSFTVTYDGSGSRGSMNLIPTSGTTDTSGKSDKQKTNNGKKNQDPALASGETFMALAAPTQVEQEMAVTTIATATAFDQSASSNSQVAWYTYDADNRTLVHEGTLSGSQIVLTAANSYEQRYDAAGNATLQVTGKGNSAAYTRSDYTLRGQLFRQWTPEATGTLQSATMLSLQNTYDANGRILEAKRYFPVGTKYTWTEEYGTITNTYDASGDLKEYDDFTYDADGRLLTQVTMGRPVGWFKQEPQPGFVEKNRIDFTTVGSGYDVAGRVKGYTYSQSSNVASQDFTFNYTYTYQGRDSWLELTIGGSSPNTAFKATTSSSTYDAYGRRTSITETTKIDNDPTHDLVNKRYFAYDYTSGILSRRDGYLKSGVWTQADEANGQLANPTPRWITAAQWNAYTSAQRIAVVANSKNLRFAYANGQLIGQTDQAGAKLDVTTRLTAYTSSDSGTSGVVVQDGDTLQGIAQKVYGNASLWYVIADANAIDSDDQLVAGVELRVPEVKVSKNDATTFKPYNPGEIIGPTAPSLPYIPPPPSNHCSTLAIIIMVVVAVVVTVFTAGAAAVAMGAALQGSIMATGVAALAGGAGMTLGVAMGAAAIGGFMGSVASQVVGKALGVVDHFSLRQAVSAGIASGLTAGIGYSGVLKSTGSVGRIVGQSKFAQGAVSAVSGNLTSYAANKVAGVDAKFSWKSIAVSAVSAGLTSEAMPTIGSKLGINLATKGGQFASDLVGGVVGGTSAMAIRRTLHIGNDQDYGQVLTDAFANTLANALTGQQALQAKAIADQLAPKPSEMPDTTVRVSGDPFGLRSYFGEPQDASGDAGSELPILGLVEVKGTRAPSRGGWSFWAWSQNQNRWVDPISPKRSAQNPYQVISTSVPWAVEPNSVANDPNVIARHQMGVQLVSGVYTKYKAGKPINSIDAKLAQLIAEAAGYDIGATGDDGVIGKNSATAFKQFLADASAGNRSGEANSGRFDRYVERVLKTEGGFVDNKADRGGATNLGVTFNTFKRYAESVGAEPNLEGLRNLTEDQAAKIYKAQYWDPLRLDEINDDSVAYLMFDFNVNSGKNSIRQAVKTLNDNFGYNLAVPKAKDALMTDEIVAAINLQDGKEFFDGYKEMRRGFYESIVRNDPSQAVFLKGWLNRLNGIQYGR